MPSLLRSHAEGSTVTDPDHGFFLAIVWGLGMFAGGFLFGVVLCV